MKPLNLVVVTETYPPEINGVAMTVKRLTEGMRSNGHRIRLVRPQQSRQDLAGNDELLVSSMPLPGYPGLRFGLPAGRALHAAWRSNRPDAVHIVTEGPLGWSAQRVARRLGIAVTSGFHTNFDHYADHYGLALLRPMVGAYLRSFHRKTDITMVPTEHLASRLRASGLDAIEVVGRGVDTRLFNPGHRSPALRESWGAADEDIICLYAGRIAEEKNLDLVVRAFEAIKARRKTARMVWVGDGPARKRIEQAHSQHIFSGMRRGTDLAAHYASADIFLFPSLTETYGNVVPEAMASGLPVLAFDTAAAAELIENGVNGRTIVALRDQSDGVRFVREAGFMSVNPEGLRAMGAAARASVEHRNWNNVFEGFERAVCKAIAASHPVHDNVMAAG